jgi:hypothetical protein
MLVPAGTAAHIQMNELLPQDENGHGSDSFGDDRLPSKQNIALQSLWAQARRAAGDAKVDLGSTGMRWRQRPARVAGPKHRQ